jgi:hypothetical protein
MEQNYSQDLLMVKFTCGNHKIPINDYIEAAGGRRKAG